MKQTLTLITLLSLFAGSVAAQKPRLSATATYTNSSGYLVPSDSQKYTYPSAGYNYSLIKTFNYVGGASTPYVNHLFTYNANGRVSVKETEIWNNSTSSYRKLSKLNYSYDSQDSIVDITSLTWNNTTQAYANTQHFVYTRDANGRTTEYKQQIWNGTTNSWRDVTRDLHTYNSQGAVIQSINQGNNNGIWKDNQLHLYTYDAAGTHLLTDTLRIYLTSSMIWRNSSITTYELNASNKPKTGTIVLWNTGTSAYDSSQLHFFAYDPAGNQISDSIRMKYPGLPWNNLHKDYDTWNSFAQLTSHTHSTWNTNAYVADSKTYYYYESAAAVPTTAASAPLFTVSPNPANDRLRIRLQSGQELTAVIVDMQGKVIQQFKRPASKDLQMNISTADMPAGSYLLRVSGADGSSAAQFITVAH